MAEIADAALAELQGAYRLLDAVMKNPDTKTDALRIFKKLNPKASVPELDVVEPVNKELKDLRGELDKLRLELANEKADAKIINTFDRLRHERGYTGEGVEKIQKLMTEKGIADPEAAADHFDRINPPQEIAQPSGWSGAKLFDEKEGSDLDKWFKDTDSMLDQEIDAAIRETRAGKI